MKFYLAGTWQDREQRIAVRNPFDNSVIDTVPIASSDDIESALATGVRGATEMSKLTGYERFEILRKAADAIRARSEELARTLSAEEGETLAESRVEISRSAQTIELSGEEAKRLGGEVLPLDGGQGVRNKFGFTLRVPCGLVVAISPFNFPLNLVCHKVGPALAAGNAVILKPASDTPLVALKLVEILLESGLPPLAVSCITGSGRDVGMPLCRDPRVRKISFTGSQAVGEEILKASGLKRVTMELGSNSPLVVLPDADLDLVAQATLTSGFANAGQVCISAQRLIVADAVRDELLHRLIPQVQALVAGDQMKSETQMGPMVREADATRVGEWIDEAVRDGARVLCGGDRSGALLSPTLVDQTTCRMKIVNEELFGPAVALLRAKDVEQAIAIAKDTSFGLSASIFTRDIDAAMRFAMEIPSGNIHINAGPMWRTDLMPYGGLKNSGLGKEGPKYAIEEMTETKTVVIHLQ